MRQKHLWALGLSLLLVGGVGQFAPRIDGTTPVDDRQAEQVVGGQYCSDYTVHDECGGSAKFNDDGTVATTCPLQQDADYNPFFGVPGSRGATMICTQCGVSCGLYDPLLVCGS